MPDESNSNVEEQLKAWARKRREEAGEPLELHPATRNLLQAEVARTFRKDAAEPSPASGSPARPGGWWKMFWPRFALAGSIGVLLVVAASLLLPGLSRTKTRSQQLVMVREEQKAPASGLERHNAADEFAAGQSRDAGAKVEQLRNETVVESKAPPTTPALVQSKPVEQEAVLDDVKSKDARRVPAEQPVKAENRQSLERSVQLAHADKESKSTPAQAQSSVNEAATTDDARRKLMMQRYGLVQERTEAGATVATADKQTLAALPQTPPSAVPLSASRRADAGQGAAGGTARNAAVGTDLALNKPQRVAPTDASSGVQAERVTTGKFVALAKQREADRAGASNAFGYGPAAVAPQVGQRFAQVQQYRVNFNSPPMPNVLRSFEVEQNGRQIRVVDADGSVYDGVIETPVNAELAKRGIAVQPSAAGPTRTDAVEAKSAEQVSLATNGATAPQNVSFQVAGTNRTLNQRVVFNGNLLANTNGTNAILLGEQVKAGRAALAPQQTRSLQSQQIPATLIQGQATIGGNNRIEINAVPVGP